MSRAVRVAVVLCLSVAAGPVARAAPPRRGFLVGLGLGAGNLRVDEGAGQPSNFGSVIYQVHFGGLITPRIGIGIAFAGSSHTDERTSITLSQRNQVLFGQFWPLERLWLRAGIGKATVSASGDGSDITYPGVGFLGTVAYEVMHAPSYGLDLGIGLWAAAYQGTVNSTTTGTFDLEFTWY